MLLREKILQLMRHSNYVPARMNEIREKLKLDKAEARGFEAEIENLLKKGYIARIKKNRLCIPQDANLVSGTINFRQSGSAILVCDRHLQTRDLEVVTISAEDTWVALHKDRVLVRLRDAPSHPRRRGKQGPKKGKPETYGRVIRILERARTHITGELQKARLFHYVVPDDPRIIQDFIVPDPATSSLKPRPQVGDKVVVQLIEWKQRHLSPEGEIVERLGKTHAPDAELKAIFRKFNLDPEFPGNVGKEIAHLPETVGKNDLKGRRDLRSLTTFTIDPDDSKDFDDALSIEELPQGQYRVGIHIADVNAYVPPDSALDREAKRRGNSTYLIGTVIPMLPHALSNGLCSLVEDEDRLTKSVLLTVTRAGRIRRTEFADTVIRSRKRLTYRQAHALLKEDDLRKVRRLPLPPAHRTGSTGRPLDSLSNDELRELQNHIRQLWDIAKRVRERRMQRGSLDLDMPEVKILVDENGYADQMERIEYDESHQLIEEYMLMANEAVAKTLKENAIPALYRVHDKPDEEKLNEFREYLIASGIRIGNLTNKDEVTKMLRKIREHPQGYTHRIQFLRSLKQACYMAEPKGHYGLAKKNYTHFTSPIRRYSDFVIHRIFEHFISRKDNRRPLHKTRQYAQSELESLAEHLSITEQNSTEAEREHNKIKQLEFFERELKKKKKTVFRAAITDIRNHGMFIELVESQTYGLVHISTMRDDHYMLHGERGELVGRRRKKRYKTGQKVDVVVDRVDRFKRQIDFSLANNQGNQ